jgi:hypothetical protein
MKPAKNAGPYKPLIIAFITASPVREHSLKDPRAAAIEQTAQSLR